MDITSYINFSVKLTDREWRLITKGLALMAGLKVSPTPEEREAAKVLNTSMLEQRERILSEQHRIAVAAREKSQLTDNDDQQ